MGKTIKYFLKIIALLIWALIFYLRHERPFLARITQNISPSLLLTTLPHTLFWISWASIPLLIFAAFKGRFFCWNICPLGLLQGLIPSTGRTVNFKNNIYIFLSLLVFSLFGLNLLAVFDPLVIFNMDFILFGLRAVQFSIFLIPMILIILASIYKKWFWCFNLCPLGAFFDWINKFKAKSSFSIDKRKTLIAIGSGLLAGGLFRINKVFSNPVNQRLLRPPGALPEKDFTDRCVRCGSCISTCLTGTLTPSFLDTGLSGIFTPKLVPQIAECGEYCNKCGQSCPTQAIKNLPLNIKRNFKIGTAEVDRPKCIAWSEDKFCLICREFCPYLAISIVKNKNGIPSPLVIPGLCRGCGHCERHCPVRPIRAIKVFNKRAGEIIK